MKKTIAILLVLVIGMVGVWAAVGDTAVLNVTTTVPMFDEIILTASDVTDYTWGAAGAVTNDNNDLGPVALLAVWDSNTPAQTVANIHARSNRAAGFSVTATATALALNEGTEQAPNMLYIPYYIVAGGASATINATAGAQPLTGKVMQVNAVAGTPFVDDSKGITVKPAGSNIDYKQGEYSADVTFIVTTL